MNKSKNELSFSLLSLLFASFLVPGFAQRPKPTPIPSTKREEAVVYPSPQSPVALNCILRGGRFCDQDGYSCLVMFPPGGGWSARISKSPEVEKQSLSGKAYVTDGTRPSLHYEFTSSPPTDVSTFPLDRDIRLDDGVSKSLGYSSVTILKGKYLVDRKMGGFGGVVFNVRLTARIVQQKPATP